MSGNTSEMMWCWHEDTTQAIDFASPIRLAFSPPPAEEMMIPQEEDGPLPSPWRNGVSAYLFRVLVRVGDTEGELTVRKPIGHTSIKPSFSHTTNKFASSCGIFSSRRRRRSTLVQKAPNNKQTLLRRDPRSYTLSSGGGSSAFLREPTSNFWGTGEHTISHTTDHVPGTPEVHDRCPAMLAPFTSNFYAHEEMDIMTVEYLELRHRAGAQPPCLQLYTTVSRFPSSCGTLFPLRRGGELFPISKVEEQALGYWGGISGPQSTTPSPKPPPSPAELSFPSAGGGTPPPHVGCQAEGPPGPD
ncbi:hypothetical protein MMC32_007949 [Xylographa parallela]|nr:hypothetical protein [Xylographa parallela]